MSVPELPYNISFPEEAFQAYLRKVNILPDELRSNFTKSIGGLCSDLNKVHDRMVTQIQNFKLQMQPQSVPVSDISPSKVIPQNIFSSAYLDPDLDPFQGITQVFRKPSDLDPRTLHLQTQARFSHPSVVTLNLTSPNLPIGIFLS